MDSYLEKIGLENCCTLDVYKANNTDDWDEL